MPSFLLMKREGIKRNRKTHFLLLRGSQLYYGPKSFTQMEHLKKKIETYKSNIGAKWCYTYCEGQRDQREKDFCSRNASETSDKSM